MRALFDLIDGWLADLDETAFIDAAAAAAARVLRASTPWSGGACSSRSGSRAGAARIAARDDRPARRFAAALPLLKLILGETAAMSDRR